MSSSVSNIVLLVGPSKQRDLVATALTGAGLAAEILDDPFEAVLRCDTDAPRAIVLHVDELDEDEVEAVRTIRELAPATRIVATFTPPHRHKGALAITVGADAYLLEPYYLTELMTLLAAGHEREQPGKVARPRRDEPHLEPRCEPHCESGADVEAPLGAPASPSRPSEPPDAPQPDGVPLEDFAGGVAHEINNPLTVICGWIEVLIAEAEPGSPRRAKLESVLEETRRIQRVVNSLQAFSREGSATFESLDLTELVEQFVTEARGEPSFDTLTIRTASGPGLPRIRGDREALRALLDQLVRNAARATEGRGTVHLETDRDARGHLRLTVSDNGRGIAPEHRDRLFRPFFSGFAGENCTGLGLAACRGIVLRHGGTIALVDRPGFGATFEMTFPPEKALPNPAD